ncbi:MAG TPA: sensor domain-containing diguanylate cyclase [Solirubrobacterales bacterium]|nr:sensor domain-containing diguanylate cyclase [Solirubrobacterales bacterium]
MSPGRDRTDGEDAPVLTVGGDGRRHELPAAAGELLAFVAVAAAVVLLIPGSDATRAAGGAALIVLAGWRMLARDRELGDVIRALPAVAFAAVISTLAAITGEPLYDVILCFNVLIVALQDGRRTLLITLAATWLALAVPAAVHPTDLGLRALVWGLLMPLLALPIQRRTEELRERVELGPKLRALQAEMLAAPDSRHALVRSAPGLAGCDLVALVEPDSAGALVITAASRTDLVGQSIPDTDDSLVHRANRAGKPVFIPDAHGEGAAELPRRITAEFPEISSWFLAPVMRSGLVAAVLCAGWGRPVHQASDLRVDVIRSLASEASTTIDHTDLLRSLSVTASRDQLTGLTNRRGWDGLLAKEMAISRSRRVPLAVAIIDLDRFKDFNDVNGHRAGDRLLREAAGAWTAAIRHGDELARWGGEEFTLLLPDCGGSCALEVVERLRRSTPGGQTCSAGVAAWDGRESAIELFERMDEALYAAKAAGRDVAMLAPPAPRPSADEIASALAGA